MTRRQVCGEIPHWDIISDNQQPVCGFLMCRSKPAEFGIEAHEPTPISDICSKKRICTNYPDLEKIGCSSASTERSLNETTCDGVCDTINCEDEGYCNGYRYGLLCRPILLYQPPTNICDGIKDCLGFGQGNFHDESSIYCNSAYNWGILTCQSGKGAGRRVPLFNFTRCAAIPYGPRKILQPYCANFVDQTNCTDSSKIGVQCYIQDYGLSAVSKTMICGDLRVGLCADKMDVQCATPSPGCTLHKHQLCDEVKDCSDGSDELLIACQDMTLERCERSYEHTNRLRIPVSWLDDGLNDCRDGVDEQPAHWPTCGKSETERYVIENSTCDDLFLCRHGPIRFIIMSQLCDGIDTCGNENELCKISRGVTSVSTEVFSVGYSTRLHYCIKGFKHIELQETPCETRVFDIFQQEIYGLKNEKRLITYPQRTFDCSYFFGLAYLYLSCFGACPNVKCPLTRAVINTDCQGQFSDRVYTIVNNKFLTFVTKKAGVYTNDFFTCKNGFCVEYGKVCNLIDDCGDGSDERECSNHHQCDENRTYISLAQKCDDKVNCEDWSDECNDQCGREIINGMSLKVAAFVIGSLALILNSFAVLEGSCEVKKGSSKPQTVINNILVLMIGVGDFLMGFYLLSVAVADVIYGESFCKKRVKWLTSRYCSALGVISTIGGQISLFALTLLSLFRAISIRSTLAPYNSGANGNVAHCGLVNVKWIALLVVPLVSVTALIAVAPLFDSFEDFFVNGLAYDSTVKLFTEPIGKDTHFELIQGYFGRAKKQTLKWSLIISLVRDMFSSDYGNLNGKVRQVHFYGNDGVCVFKYFVNENDPQRYYSLSVQVINTLCFIIVAVSYISINTTTVSLSNPLTKTNSPTSKLIRKRNKKLQRKIAAIIVTDFACWIPFVIVSFLHFFEVMDASRQYGLFSVVILPINSVINPFFYGNHIATFTANAIFMVPNMLSKGFSRFVSMARIRKFQRKAEQSDIELQTQAKLSPVASSEIIENPNNRITPL